jgi:hypothetical protein
MDQHQNVISRTRNPICMTHRVRIKINKKTEGKKCLTPMHMHKITETNEKEINKERK